jgi:hypothetical protein
MSGMPDFLLKMLPGDIGKLVEGLGPSTEGLFAAIADYRPCLLGKQTVPKLEAFAAQHEKIISNLRTLLDQMSCLAPQCDDGDEMRDDLLDGLGSYAHDVDVLIDAHRQSIAAARPVAATIEGTADPLSRGVPDSTPITANDVQVESDTGPFFHEGPGNCCKDHPSAKGQPCVRCGDCEVTDVTR